MQNNLFKKGLVFGIITLFVGAGVFPVTAIVDENDKLFENQIRVESEPQNSATTRVDEWPMLHHDPENTGYSTSNVARTNKIKWIYATGSEVTSSPAVVNGKVYIGSVDEHFYCLDADTGQELWKYYIPGLAGCSPAVYNGKVYIDSTYDWFYCLDADTGNLTWKFYKGYRFSRPAPVVVDGKVYFAHSRGGTPGEGQNASLYCLDADTGDKLWDYHWGFVELSSPAVYKGKVYIGSEDDNFYCFDADTGDILWIFQTFGTVLSSPAVFDEKVYFCVSYGDNKLYCLNASSGDDIWNYTIGISFCSPAVAYGNVYVGNNYDDTFFCFNASTGDLIWDYTGDSGFSFSSPAVADGKVYVGTFQSRCLLCLDASSGELYWSYTLSNSNHLTSSPAIAYGRIYIGGGMSRNVYCFENLNSPPDTPTINGPTSGKPNVEYDFTFNATDPEEDAVMYNVDWGDNNTEWTEYGDSGVEVTLKHTWTSQGTFTIKAQAVDIHGAESDWIEFTVKMPRNKAVTNNMVFWRLLERFPMLQKLLISL